MSSKFINQNLKVNFGITVNKLDRQKQNIFKHLGDLILKFNENRKLAVIPYDVNRVNIYNIFTTEPYTAIYIYYLIEIVDSKNIQCLFRIPPENYFVYLNLNFVSKGDIDFKKSVLFIGKNLSLLFAMFYPKSLYTYKNNNNNNVVENNFKSKVLFSLLNDGFAIICPAVFENFLTKFRHEFNKNENYIKNFKNNRDINNYILKKITPDEYTSMIKHFTTYIEAFLNYENIRNEFKR